MEGLLPEIARYVRARAGKDVRRVLEASDLVQRTVHVFLRRLGRLPECETTEELHALVRQLARWEIGRALESSARRVARAASSPPPEPANPTRSRGSVTRADDHRQLGRVLAELRPVSAEVLRLRLMEGKSLAAVAHELGLAPETVKKRLQSARKELAERAARWVRSERGARGGHR